MKFISMLLGSFISVAAFAGATSKSVEYFEPNQACHMAEYDVLQQARTDCSASSLSSLVYTGKSITYTKEQRAICTVTGKYSCFHEESAQGSCYTQDGKTNADDCKSVALERAVSEAKGRCYYYRTGKLEAYNITILDETYVNKSSDVKTPMWTASIHIRYNCQTQF